MGEMSSVTRSDYDFGTVRREHHLLSTRRTGLVSPNKFSGSFSFSDKRKHMMTLEEVDKVESWDLSKHHPDHEWLKQFHRWELTVNLTYRNNEGWKKDARTRRAEINQLFASLANELSGLPRPESLSWYVKWQVDEKNQDHFHAHGVLGSNEKVNIFKGRRTSFTGYPPLIEFLGSRWGSGLSFFQPIRNQDGWINYITRPNPIQETWTSPAMKSLKSQWDERRVNEILAR